MKHSTTLRIKAAFLVPVLLCLLTASSNAQSKGFGVGVIIGEPTGLSAKGWVSSNSALDFGVAWSFRGAGYMHVHADYLWHFSDAINTTQEIAPYLGLGGRLAARQNNSVLGVRLVGGIVWWPSNTPLDVFLEVAPIVDVAPATELSANGGIGVRFYLR